VRLALPPRRAAGVLGHGGQHRLGPDLDHNVRRGGEGPPQAVTPPPPPSWVSFIRPSPLSRGGGWSNFAPSRLAPASHPYPPWVQKLLCTYATILLTLRWNSHRVLSVNPYPPVVEPGYVQPNRRRGHLCQKGRVGGGAGSESLCILHGTGAPGSQ